MYHTAAARRRHAAPASAPPPQEPTQGRFDGPSSRAKVQAVLDRARSRTARRSSVNGSDGSTAAAAVALVVSRSTLLRCGCVLLVALALLGVLAVSARRTLGVSVAHARDAEIVHSQQRWFYMGHEGEIAVDQAHRGYTVCTDRDGFASVNPLFWKPARDATTGAFAGQRCYGYLSFEAFVDAASCINAGKATPSEYNSALPTLATTAGATAILEAGRRSLDAGGRPIELTYSDQCSEIPIGLRAVEY